MEQRRSETPVRVGFDPSRKGPLDGVRVLDLTRLVAGNMLSLQLGDLGAEVMKVEPPQGDPLREWLDDGKPLFWKTYARNKRSIVLNLRIPDAKEALLRLVETADVMMENYRPGTLEEMALGPDVLHGRNPGLIVARISGFGQTGPYAELPGFGTLVEAMSGFAARTGFADREPVLPPMALADMVAGLYGAGAVVTALFARERGQGPGQVIDVSLLEAVFSIMGPEAAIYRETGAVKGRIGSASNTSAPRNVYRCADGKYVALSASIQSMAKRVFDLIGKPQMIEDPRFRTNSDRIRNRVAMDEILGAWFSGRTRDDALRLMRDAEITLGPVYNIDDAIDDEHFREREIICEVEDADFGSIPMHNIVPRLSATPGVWRRPAPQFGEHTAAILAEAGYDDAGIANLRKLGAAR